MPCLTCDWPLREPPTQDARPNTTISFLRLDTKQLATFDFGHRELSPVPPADPRLAAARPRPWAGRTTIGFDGIALRCRTSAPRLRLKVSAWPGSPPSCCVIVHVADMDCLQRPY
eukprot:SAG22_NODE_934_length_6428_cov_3.928267_1_plen_114_part_10